MTENGRNWNPVVGCTPYSDGCLNCFAKPIAKRWHGGGIKGCEEPGFNLRLMEKYLNKPLNWPDKPERPRRCLVCTMGDLFHKPVPDKYIYKVFYVMGQVPQHRFFVITKREKRLGELGPYLPWKPWIWAGITIESSKYVFRLDYLKRLPDDVYKFLLLEPLLSKMPKLDLEGIHWVIVGGETEKGGNFRPMKEEWVLDIRDQVKSADIPFMFKHWPGRTQNSTEALLQGRRWEEFPESVIKNMDWD